MANISLLQAHYWSVGTVNQLKTWGSCHKCTSIFWEGGRGSQSVHVWGEGREEGGKGVNGYCLYACKNADNCE